MRASICLAALLLLPHALTQQSLGPGRKYSSVQRMSLDRLKAVHEDRARIQSGRRDVALQTGWSDFRGILHAHAEDSAHTGGTRPEMLEAARQAGVQFIFLTDHIRPERDFIDDSWRGLREGVLFVPGAEGEGFLNFPVASVKGMQWLGREGWIGLIKANGGNIFLSHVEEKRDWDTAHLDGLEIYNHHTDVQDESQFMGWLRGALIDPERLAALQKALELYPAEVMGVQQDYLTPIIRKWDRDTQSHRLTGVAANDCHHNQGFRITAADARSMHVDFTSDRQSRRTVTVDQAPKIASLLEGKQPGDLIAFLDLDPYDRSMRYVTTHVLAEALTEEALRGALRAGRAYVAHDWLCDPTGFAVVAESGGLRGTMGDVLPLRPEARLRVEAPVEGEIRLLRNGVPVEKTLGRAADYAVREPGVHRVEIWLEVDGEHRPWIYANPVYITP